MNYASRRAYCSSGEGVSVLDLIGSHQSRLDRYHSTVSASPSFECPRRLPAERTDSVVVLPDPVDLTRRSFAEDELDRGAVIVRVHPPAGQRLRW